MHTVNRVDGPQNLAVNLRARARGKWVGLSRNKIESGWLPTQRERIITQCAKVAPNLPESGITYQFLVSPEHHPSAAVHPPIPVGEERSSSSHCSEFRQRSSPYRKASRLVRYDCGRARTDSRPVLPSKSRASGCNAPAREQHRCIGLDRMELNSQINSVNGQVLHRVVMCGEDGIKRISVRQ